MSGAVRRCYAMRDTCELAALGVAEVTAFLQGRPDTRAVLNVEADRRYQARDVDLVWLRHPGCRRPRIEVEVKTDRYHHTGNYFFETISNQELAKPGCFLYTEAEYLFYYFLPQRELHILPVAKCQAWFKARQQEFKTTPTTTPHQTGVYTTIGALVPRHRVLAEVPGVLVLRI